MNKKVILIGCVVLLFLCSLCASGLFLLFGNFELNNTCIYKGPLATLSGSCIDTIQSNTEPRTNQNIVEDNSNLVPEFKVTNQDWLVYSAGAYTIEYPEGFVVDNSDPARLFVFAENGSDNLNISSQFFEIEVNQPNCDEFANNTLTELADADPRNLSVSVVSIWGAQACKVSFTAQYQVNERINQTQYYLSSGVETYFLTVSTSQDSDSFQTLDMIAKSIIVE